MVTWQLTNTQKTQLNWRVVARTNPTREVKAQLKMLIQYFKSRGTREQGSDRSSVGSFVNRFKLLALFRATKLFKNN